MITTICRCEDCDHRRLGRYLDGMTGWRLVWWVARVGWSVGVLVYAAGLVLFTAPL